MNYEWFIAKRFLQSQKRGGALSFITLFAILGITLGTAALIITLSILAGFEKEIKEKVITFVTHIQVQGFHSVPLAYNPEQVKSIPGEIEGVETITPFVAREGMIRFKKAVDGIYLKGIDTATEHRLLKRYLIQGKFLEYSTEQSRQIVLGKKLADKLSVSVGDSVILFGISGNTLTEMSPKAMKMGVIGIYESGMSEYDDIYAFTSLENAQTLFSFEDKISGYDVTVKNLDEVETIASRLNEKLGYPHIARSMYQLYRNLFAWIDLQKELSPILLVLIIVVATINIFSTLLMFVVEKVKAVGILGTIGATTSSLQRIFFYQGILISLIGIVLGNLLGFLVCYLQKEFRLISLPSDIYFMNSVPIELEYLNFLLISLIAFLLSIITTYLPSRVASRIDLISAIRFS